MNCQKVRDLLSAYYDDELSPEIRSRVAEHLNTCEDCATELVAFRELSRSAGELQKPAPPARLWKKIAGALAEEESLGDEVERVVIDLSATSRRSVCRWASIAASVLLVLGLGAYGLHSWHGHSHHKLAADFSAYLDAYQENPSDAHMVLVSKYPSQNVALEVAHEQLGYRPTLAHGLPDGYTMAAAYVLEMPCCKCLQSICKRADGATVAVFEHNEEQPNWFGDRNTISTQCGGQDCHVTELDAAIAVSWKRGERHLTIVGATDVEEAASLVRFFSQV